ncbi:MAG TPA: nuclear transport factor 2 family protein [Pyrinomonadaceae bacterium]
MKKMIMVILIAIAAMSFAFGQTKMANDSKIETQIIALEKAGWEAWKNKDGSWTRDNVTEEFLLVNSEGVANKMQVVKSTATDCEVKGYSLDNFKFVTLDKDSVLMTYTAKQDGVCSGKPIPANVRASVVYVRRGGKWLEAFYMETPMN